MTVIYVDADACPVKKEVYRVAERYRFEVVVVSDSYLHVPPIPLFRLQMVDRGEDAADQWIVEQIEAGDICVTADIPLAALCIEKNAHVISPRGKRFDAETIGEVVASRNLMKDLRESGMLELEGVGGGPPPFGKKDRSRFLNHLDQLIQAVKRGT